MRTNWWQTSQVGSIYGGGGRGSFGRLGELREGGPTLPPPSPTFQNLPTAASRRQHPKAMHAKLITAPLASP